VPPYPGQVRRRTGHHSGSEAGREGPRHETIVHSYPHCWRTDTPLIYKAVSSWFVRVTAFRERMVELNRRIRWIPEHVARQPFGNCLEGARDWSITAAASGLAHPGVEE
jgi:isoleucyl-tRNA synthetase